jgi:hypothetical protein
MIINSMRVRTSVKQIAEHIGVALTGRPQHSGHSIVIRARLEWRTARQESLGCLSMAKVRGKMQSGECVIIECVEGCASLNHCRELRDIILLYGIVQRSGRDQRN